ncbi:MAG: VWA domain-containing protein [Planctomycetota bacterium]|nr:VWA domain-containing protein [Planctomycetota bacterium]MDA0918302.1 VWA domain-containing protein [Planctomycetota bacterium]MDA1158881.1 VWA domain-containing protein [Planctomycetota bacterium]
MRAHLSIGAFAALTIIAIGCGRSDSYRAGSTTELYDSAPAAGVATPDANWDEALANEESPQSVENTEDYELVVENKFRSPLKYPLSTFSIDVDTASYSNVRRFLNDNVLPPPAAVRIEELINYFKYDYSQPVGEHPFSVNLEIARCPWHGEHWLARVGLKGLEIDREQKPAANLVFLLDVSGSMNSPDKLPLVKSAMRMLLDQLDEDDRVAIAVYAGASGLVLPPTSASDRGTILTALERLNAGGSTNGGQGIQLAYQVAAQNLIQDGVNRVILCTDGDFNVGITDRSELIDLIQAEAKRGVFLSVLGFGTGNLKDATMEQLADKGNGNYGYIDSLQEARKLLVEDALGTLVTIAKDVKIQIDFNPQHVQAYRLIGYENRMLQDEDFRDDRKDAGEIGAGHTVTALYEIIPAGVDSSAMVVEPSKYQEVVTESAGPSDEVMTVRLRYKHPEGDEGIEFHVPVGVPAEDSRGSEDFQFAASVAGFGMLLRDSQYSGDATFELVETLARNGVGQSDDKYRHEFLRLIDAAKLLKSPHLAGR